MSKIVIRTDTVDGFSSARRTRPAKPIRRRLVDDKVTLSFEDPQRMFTVLPDARRRLVSEVMREPQTIKELTGRLHRNRSAVTKDVGMLEKIGLNRLKSAIESGARLSKGCAFDRSQD